MEQHDILFPAFIEIKYISNMAILYLFMHKYECSLHYQFTIYYVLYFRALYSICFYNKIKFLVIFKISLF